VPHVLLQEYKIRIKYGRWSVVQMKRMVRGRMGEMKEEKEKDDDDL
jgi:hypothetical protein